RRGHGLLPGPFPSGDRGPARAASRHDQDAHPSGHAQIARQAQEPRGRTMTSENGPRAEPDPACRWQESLALHALWSLGATEVPGLIEHLATGCAVCVAEHARLQETLAIMDVCQAQDAASAPTPSASLRARLMQAVA